MPDFCRSIAGARTIVLAVLTLAGTGCHSGPAAAGDNAAPKQALLLPGSPLLTPPALGDTTVAEVVYLRRGQGDTVEKKMADTRRGQQAVPGRRADVLMTVVWDPPFSSLDSLVIERHGLQPLTEHLDFHGSFTYRYDRNRVEGTVRPGDSAQRAYDQTFPSNVFAFNELELLARSLPFKEGLSVVVPLFSEVDRALEMDTPTVMGPDTSSAGRGRNAWLVRFADPSIVDHLVIDRASRELITSEVFPRKTEMRMRYAPS
jgi:hypothetical protein